MSETESDSEVIPPPPKKFKPSTLPGVFGQPSSSLDHDKVVTSKEDSKLDFKDVLEELTSIEEKWKRFGLQVGLPSEKLREIEAKHPNDPKDSLFDVLEEYLNGTSRPSWEDISKALRSKSVGEVGLAKEVEEKYCKSGITKQSTEGSSEPSGASNSMPDTEVESVQPSLVTKQEVMTAKEIVDMIPQEHRNAVVTDVHIAEIAPRILSWEELAPFLSISSAEEEEIRNDFQGRYGLQKRAALRKWKERMDSKATYHALIEALEKGELATKPKGGNSVLDTFRAYLTDCYAGKQHPAQQQWPSELHTPCYVDLSLHDMPISPPLSTPGAPEQAKINKRIELGQIFTAGSSKAKRKVVLIEGVAGSGKTTLSWHACQKWATGELFQQFDLLIHVSLADPSVHFPMSLADIIPHPSSEVREAVAKAIAEQHGKRVCFLFDGADEVPPSAFQRQSFLYKLLAGTGPRSTLSHCSIVLTSRPEQASQLLSLVTARLLIKGFEEKQLNEFFHSTLRSTLQQLQEAFAVNPNLASLCSLPINAAVMAHNFHFFKENLPSTQTDLFRGLVGNFLVRHIQLRTTELQQPVTDFNDLPPSVLEKFKALCALAYNAMRENKRAFGAEILRPLNLSFPVDALGLLQVHQQLTMFGPERRYTFPHLAIEEFLASVHMSYMSDKEQTKAVKEILKKNPLSPVLPFYAGITRLANTSAQKELLDVCQLKMDVFSVFSSMAKNPSDDRRRQFLALTNCIYEAQQGELCKLMGFRVGTLTPNDVWLSLAELQLLPTDCISIGYTVRHLSMSATKPCTYKIDLSSCNLSGTSIAALVYQLKQESQSKWSVLDVCVTLLLQSTYFSNKSMEKIRLLLQEPSIVKYLDLGDCSFEDVFFGLKCLIEGLSCGPCREIGMPIGLNSVHIYHLCYLLIRCRLDRFTIAFSDFSEMMPLFAAALDLAPHLSCLGMMDCKIDDDGLLCLGRVLCENTTVHTLGLLSNPFSEHALTNFLEMFIHKPQSSLSRLDLGRELNRSQTQIIDKINWFRLQSGNFSRLSNSTEMDFWMNKGSKMEHDIASIPPENLRERKCT